MIGDTVDIYDRDSEDPNNFMQYYKTMNPGVLKFQQRDAEPNEAGYLQKYHDLPLGRNLPYFRRGSHAQG